MEFTKVLAYWRDQWKGQQCPECRLGVEAHHLSIVDESSPPISTCKYDENGELKPGFKPFFDADYKLVSRSRFDRTPIPGRAETLRDKAVAEEHARHKQEIDALNARHREETESAQKQFARIIAQNDAEAESRIKAAEMRMLEAQAKSKAAVEALEVVATLFRIPKKLASAARGDFTPLINEVMARKDAMAAKIEELGKKRLAEIQGQKPVKKKPNLKVVATPPPIPQAARKG